MQHIQTIDLASAQASIIFSDIPQGFTDLLLFTSLRDDTANAGWAQADIRPNQLTTNLSSRYLLGWSTNTAADSAAYVMHQLSRGGNEAGTFSNSSVYIYNYTSNSFKNISVDTSPERNNVAALNAIVYGRWSSTDPITSLQIIPTTGGNLAQFSSASLYGILAGSDGITAIS